MKVWSNDANIACDMVASAKKDAAVVGLENMQLEKAHQCCSLSMSCHLLFPKLKVLPHFVKWR